jgi:hypothetical protein
LPLRSATPTRDERQRERELKNGDPRRSRHEDERKGYVTSI